MAQLPVRNLAHIGELIVVDHDTVDLQLLIDTADHDLFIDGLIAAADKIAVEIHIQVIQVLHVGQRVIYENVIHIEGVLRKLQSTFPQQLGPVNDRMHQDILALVQEFHIIPGKDLILGKRGTVAHDFFMLGTLFFIDEIADEHIHHRLCAGQLLQGL